MYPIPGKGLPLERALADDVDDDDGGADHSSSFPRAALIFQRRIVTSFFLFSPYCRALTFNGSFPRVETIAQRLLLSRGARGAAMPRTWPGPSSGVRPMKGHEGEVRRERRRGKKIIRQRQHDKQEGKRRGKRDERESERERANSLGSRTRGKRAEEKREGERERKTFPYRRG
jgi:hypothetical protein